MPSYRDNNDVVHDVQLVGTGTWARCGLRFVPDEPERYGWAPEQRVNCVGCLNGAEPMQEDVVFVVCKCGQWWREEGEGLVLASSEETQKMGSGFLAMCDGTLLSCRKCRPW